MKIKKSRLKQIIAEEMQLMVKSDPEEGRDDFNFESYDDGSQMSDYQLNRIADLAVMIDDIVSDETNLPDWVKSKLTLSQDYLSKTLNYLKGKMADAEEDMMEARKTTPEQRKKIKKRAEEIKDSTISQYGKKEGTSAAFAIATDQVLGEQ